VPLEWVVTEVNFMVNVSFPNRLLYEKYNLYNVPTKAVYLAEKNIGKPWVGELLTWFDEGRLMNEQAG
jgi:hypothetical protein